MELPSWEIETDEDRFVFEVFGEVFKPQEVLTVSEWADRYRVLSSVSSAVPGQWRTSRTPYAREIMDNLSDTSPVQEVVVVAGAQVAKTEIGLNWFGYTAHLNPGPMLVVQPTIDGGKTFSKQRVRPMITDCPVLAERIKESRSRDSGNTLLTKEYPGGFLKIAGANAAAGLRMMPMRNVHCDEVDAYPVDVEGEGDPVELAKARTNSFGARKKVLQTSTPKDLSTSRIWKSYLQTDQRKFFVPCPHCGNMDFLRWSNFIIPKDEQGRMQPEKCHMVCTECGGVIEEMHKTEMLERGEWRATCEDKVSGKRRGYHLPGLYAPIGFKSWIEIAEEWIAAQGNQPLLKKFVNTALGECWIDKGETVDHTGLMARAEDYSCEPLPEGVYLITMGVDVQRDRIEFEVVGWGAGNESWSLDYKVIYGDPAQDMVWQLLDLEVQRIYSRPNGQRLKAARVFVDSGDGFHTQRIYSYTFPRAGIQVYACKGQAGDDRQICGAPTKQKLGDDVSKVVLYPVGTFAAKDAIYWSLRLGDPGRGYCHFPKRYGPTYYEQLTAEEVKTKMVKGFAVREWHKIRDRNEALDCRVYAYAALHSLAVDMDQIKAIMDGQVVVKPRERRSVTSVE